MTELQVRPVRGDDAEAFDDFINRIPEGDRTFFKEDIRDRQVVAFLLQGERGIRLVAVSPEGRIDGYGAVLPGVCWSMHVGDLRLVVDPGRRRQGVGRGLARRLLVEALGQGMSKLTVQVVADQQPAVLMFQELGFAAEGLLRDHVRDRSGELRDLLVLSHLVGERSQELAAIGVEGAVP